MKISGEKKEVRTRWLWTCWRNEQLTSFSHSSTCWRTKRKRGRRRFVLNVAGRQGKRSRRSGPWRPRRHGPMNNDPRRWFDDDGSKKEDENNTPFPRHKTSKENFIKIKFEKMGKVFGGNIRWLITWQQIQQILNKQFIIFEIWKKNNSSAQRRVLKLSQALQPYLRYFVKLIVKVMTSYVEMFGGRRESAE